MKLFFGGAVAVVLLGIYLHLIRMAVLVAGCDAAGSCGVFNDGMAQALSTISGLVSALLIAILAATDPGDPPLKRLFAGEPGPLAKGAAQIVAGAYILAWLGGGFAAFYVGLHHPREAPPALVTLGQSWLGLAVSAAYAYFGIRQTPQPPSLARHPLADDAPPDALR